MDVPKPPQYIEDLPEGPPNQPGGFDLSVNDRYTDAFRDQKMRRLEHYPISFTSSALQTIEVPEYPEWYLLCVRACSAAGPTPVTLLDLVLTLKQGQGDSIELRLPYSIIPSYNGVSADLYTPWSQLLRYIARAESRQLTLSVPTLTGSLVTVKGNLYLVGASVDPTKVGEF